MSGRPGMWCPAMGLAGCLLAATIASGCRSEPTIVIDLRASADGSTPTTAAPAPSPARDAEMNALVSELMAKYWRAFPTAATLAGLHEWDDQLEEMSPSAIETRSATFRGYRDRLATIADTDLSAELRIDKKLLLSELDWLLLDAERIRSWKSDPGLYNDLAAVSAFSLMVRKAVDPKARARALLGRLGRIPALMGAATTNLGEETSPLAIETAIRDARGSVDFFESAVPRFFLDAAGEDAALVADGRRAAKSAADAMRDYVVFLEKDLTPRAKGGIALGRELYLLKSRYRNFVGLAPEVLASRGLAEVKRLQAEMRLTADGLAPGRSVEEALIGAAADHPTAEGLLTAYADGLGALRSFVAEKRLITLPADDEVKLLETPGFARSMIFAAVFTPGPYESEDLTTYYMVTPIDRSRSAAVQAEQLREHALSSIDVVSIHEAYPGHHVQLLIARGNLSEVRRMVSSPVFTEGWAHYGEEMMIEEGFHPSARLRLFMLREALLRACRMHVDPMIHLGRMDFAAAKAFYAKECYQGEVTAEMEARRAALAPATVYIYTLGKMHIRTLRDTERSRKGPAFDLGAFHDALLSHGSIPLPILSEAYFGMAPGELEAAVAAGTTL